MLGWEPRKRSPQEQESESHWARSLLGSKNFALLMTDAADRLAREWSVVDVRDTVSLIAARYKLEGLRALERELQIMVDQGLPTKPGGSSDSKPIP
jgi:hypothetical protein